MTNVFEIQLDRKNLQCDGRQVYFYEYNFTDWFTNSQLKIDEKPFAEKIIFKLSLLRMESSWEIEKVDENGIGRVFSIKRCLKFIPFEETKKWSITIDLLDVLGITKDCLGTIKQFKGLTANNENPCVEYELRVQETEVLRLFTNQPRDYFCKLFMSTVKCSGLSSYLSPSYDFSSSFEGSNVLLEIGPPIPHLYFLFELLAVHSPVLYKIWQSKESLTVQEDHHVVPMEMDEREFDGLITILKMMMYKKNFIDDKNVESVASVAKKWKFEMILAACEDFFIKRINGDIYKLNCLAQQYDMSQLQHEIWEYQEKQLERLKEWEEQEAERARMELRRRPTQNSYLQYITAEKFDLPEITTNFITKSDRPLKFTAGEKDFKEITIRAFLDWRIYWNYAPPGRVFLDIKPCFPSYERKKRLFCSKNWSIHVQFTVTFNGKERIFDVIFSEKKKKDTFQIESKVGNVENVHFNYTIQTRVKCAKGLRYFADDSDLRYFSLKTPSSDIVLKCSDRKLFANLNILSMFSPFFKGFKEHTDMQTMDEEEQLQTVNMEDIASSIVVRILNYVYSINRNPITTKHLEFIIPVADRFLFSGLVHQCEQQLLKGPYHPLEVRTLDFAISYNLHALKDCYLKSFKSLSELQKLKMDRNYDDLSDAAKLLFYEAMMNLPLEE